MTSDRRSIASYAHIKPQYSPLSRQLPRIMNQTILLFLRASSQSVGCYEFKEESDHYIPSNLMILPLRTNCSNCFYRVQNSPKIGFCRKSVLSFVFTDLKVTAVLLPTRPHANLSPWCLSAVAQLRVKCFFDVY